MDDDAPRRTVPIKLNVPEQRRGDLHQTKEQFLHCANRTSGWAWRYDKLCITSKSKADDALYDDLREKTDLTSNLVQKGIRRAIQAVTGGVEKLKQGESTTNTLRRSTTTTRHFPHQMEESKLNTFPHQKANARAHRSVGTTRAMNGMAQAPHSSTTDRPTRSTCTSR